MKQQDYKAFMVLFNETFKLIKTKNDSLNLSFFCLHKLTNTYKNGIIKDVIHCYS